MVEKEKKIPEFTPEEEYFINNHLVEIAALPKEKFSQFVEDCVKLRTDTVEVAQTLHPDSPGKYDLARHLMRDIDLLVEIVRRARELRSNS